VVLSFVRSLQLQQNKSEFATWFLWRSRTRRILNCPICSLRWLPMTRTFTLGSRASQLAQVQTLIVRGALEATFRHTNFDVRFMITGGDKNKKDALYLLGGKSLWTEELEDALIKGEIDIIVHSLKDVSTKLPEGCEIGAIMEREDPDDALVVKNGLGYKTLDELPEGSVVGTSSVRRVAQLKRAYPKLVFQDIRGNCDTRLNKLDDPNGPFVAIILASAGLIRLDLTDRITSSIGPPTLYHAVGQGALGIECRNDDIEIKQLLSKALSHYPTEMRCRAERACLRVLEGGCSVPVGIESTFVSSGGDEKVGRLEVTSTVTSLSGEVQVKKSMVLEKACGYEDAERLGEEVARALIDGGARSILDEVNVKRAEKQKRDEERAKAKEMAAAAASVSAVECSSSGSSPTLVPRHVDSFDSFLNQSYKVNPITTDPTPDSTPSSTLFSLLPLLMRFSPLSLSSSSSISPVARKERRRQFPGAWPEEDL